MPYIGAVLLVLLAAIAGFQHGKSTKQSLDRLGGFFVIFFAVIIVLVFWLPGIIDWVARQNTGWDNVGYNLQSSMPFIGLPSGGYGPEDAPDYNGPTPTPSYIMVAPAGQQEYVPPSISTTPEPAPEPTAMPTPDPEMLQRQAEIEMRTNLYADLETARVNGDRATGKVLIDTILAEWSQDPVALQARDDILAAEQRMAQLNGLWDVTKDDDTRVAPAMAGLEFLVVDDGAETWRTKWSEKSTVRVISEGWLRGFQFTLPRGALGQFGVDSTGQRFHVRL